MYAANFKSKEYTTCENQCKLKIVERFALLKLYPMVIAIYEEEVQDSLNNILLKSSVHEYPLNAGLWHICEDGVAAERAMSPQSKYGDARTLEGVHGVHIVPHSPFLVKEITQCGDFHYSSTHDSGAKANQRLSMQRLWHQIPTCMRPVRCSLHGDQNAIETIANVLTSIPFIALGIHAPRQLCKSNFDHQVGVKSNFMYDGFRKNLNSKLYANSLIGVGVASCLYHSSRGELRKYLRWADYTMIAASTVCLSRAISNENPKLVMATSALFLPIQPLMVSAFHTGLMEVEFAKRALSEPDLRMAHTVHKMSSILGGALFVADDVFPRTPYLHAAWHLAAAIGVGTCNKLLL
ncbi:hypothetical protein GIB67_001121 [Kingdonia uniflora]|uniref:Uncharacterized protein n=1 Tax=Kingdonia uniflora TaxID=39325 RepID=A0A7J7MH29_9MAGN|nr:hypothetical protein GIB67_001121 [Kingdonia uniflora]